jgi:hypothetical protein
MLAERRGGLGAAVGVVGRGGVAAHSLMKPMAMYCSASSLRKSTLRGNHTVKAIRSLRAAVASTWLLEEEEAVAG